MKNTIVLNSVGDIIRVIMSMCNIVKLTVLGHNTELTIYGSLENKIFYYRTEFYIIYLNEKTGNIIRFEWDNNRRLFAYYYDQYMLLSKRCETLHKKYNECKSEYEKKYDTLTTELIETVQDYEKKLDFYRDLVDRDQETFKKMDEKIQSYKNLLADRDNDIETLNDTINELNITIDRANKLLSERDENYNFLSECLDNQSEIINNLQNELKEKNDLIDFLGDCNKNQVLMIDECDNDIETLNNTINELNATVDSLTKKNEEQNDFINMLQKRLYKEREQNRNLKKGIEYLFE